MIKALNNFLPSDIVNHQPILIAFKSITASHSDACSAVILSVCRVLADILLTRLLTGDQISQHNFPPNDQIHLQSLRITGTIIRLRWPKPPLPLDCPSTTITLPPSHSLVRDKSSRPTTAVGPFDHLTISDEAAWVDYRLGPPGTAPRRYNEPFPTEIVSPQGRNRY